MAQKPHSPAWPPQAPRRDSDLVARIKRREPEALGALYDRYGRLAYFVILRIVDDEERAEELLAETFVTVWNQIERWKEGAEDLRLWLLLVGRMHALEYLRKRNEALPKALPRASALMQPNLMQDFPRPRDPEDWANLRETVSSLSGTEMRIVEMASFDGMTTAEIAVSLGESVGAVKSAVRQALEKLER